MNKFTIYRQQIYTLLENFGCAKITSQRDNETTDFGFALLRQDNKTTSQRDSERGGSRLVVS